MRNSALVWVVLLGVLSCGDNQDDAGARALLARVKKEAYRSWDRPAGWETRRKSAAPHGDAVDIYVNDVVVEALLTPNASRLWPEGSLIVKEGYDDGELDLVAIMEKRSDGWYFAEYDSDGDPSYSGHPDTCIDCHKQGNDYVRAFNLP
jgi:hypothetical protein